MANKKGTWSVRIAIVLTTLSVLVAVGCGDGPGPGPPTTPTPPTAPETVTACCSSGPQQGYVKTGDEWNPTSCGNPSTITYNVCTYTRYDNKQIGARMDICADQIVPKGWVIKNSQWDPTKCGHPSTISYNINTIEKIS